MGVMHSFKVAAKEVLPRQLQRIFSDIRESRKKRNEFWEWSSEDQRRSDFYRQFAGKGGLVFDVGANMGNRSKVFCRLGARVVAVEPQVKCSEYLSLVFRNKKNFSLVRKALGSAPGISEIMISNASTISSLSPDWIRSVKESGRFAEYEWSQRETVGIDTLDNLIAEHGRPDFIKIDVEGFEDKVLAGLTFPVKALSLEFSNEFLESTFICIERMAALGDYRFQISLGESMKYDLPDWVDAVRVKKVLSQYPAMSYGDLYASLPPQKNKNTN